jgi:uncharacterized RDD family membrane protein YckC
MNSQLRIRTPEGIVFSYTLAGPVTRCLACAVDILFITAVCQVVAQLLRIGGLISQDFAQAIAVVSFFTFSISYSMLCEWLNRGQTLGKKMLHLRVMDANGLRLQFHQVVMRNLLRFVDMLPFFYMLGGLVSIFSPRAQRLGDLAAGTVVVHNPKHSEPDLDQLLAGKFNSLRAYPHLEARLRQRVSPAEARLALQALTRRDDLEPAARVELFADLAAHFKALVTFPAEISEALPDEQYIRNVVDILFRTRANAMNQTIA